MLVFYVRGYFMILQKHYDGGSLYSYQIKQWNNRIQVESKILNHHSTGGSISNLLW